MPAPKSAPAWPSPAAGWYATVVLLIAYTFSFVDRQVLNLLVEPIRADLRLSDTEISFLQGLAFVIPYVLMSVPVGRLVDRFNRLWVLLGGVLVWSVTTFACGLSRSYEQLLAARMGVGAGEASVTPASWSLLADYFPPDRLARPVSVFLMGPYIGAGIAMIAGAEVIAWTQGATHVDVPVLGSVATWQFTFMAVAVPGLLIALLLLTLKQPARQGVTVEDVEVPTWSAVFAFLRAHARIYLAILLGVPCIVVVLYGLQGWTPTILVRVSGWDLADAGRVYGLVALVCGSAGVLAGPVVGRILERRGYADYPLRLGCIAAVGVVASIAWLPLQSTGGGALMVIGAASFFVTLPLALMTFAVQTVTPSAMRGVLAGLYVVATNVIGLGFGPTLVASTTDYVFADPARVADSLALVSALVAPLSALLLGSGLSAYRARLGGAEN